MSTIHAIRIAIPLQDRKDDSYRVNLNRHKRLVKKVRSGQALKPKPFQNLRFFSSLIPRLLMISTGGHNARYRIE